MTPLLRRVFLIFVFAVSPVGFASFASADVDPSAVFERSSEDPGTSTDPGASTDDTGASNALGQFPRTEMALVTPPRAGLVPPAGMLASEGAQTAPNDTDFPKIQTAQDEEMARKFAWWPTDAKPGPYKDPDRSGYWWWPEIPGESRPWGNQGYVYVRKIIFDYKTTEGPMKPSLVIKRIIKNVKILFDFDKSDLRDDARNILDKAMYTLQHNLKADILVTGNADIRGSEQYNQKLGERRAAAVQDYLTQQGLAPDRIRILSRGKLDALAPTHDIVGMQKDRNAQFVIAEVEEVMIPADKAGLFEDNVIEEKQDVESAVRVSEKEYTIQSGDTLWDIAKREYGDGRQWKRIYEYNQDVITNPNRPKKGTRIRIPIE
jgi:outer membrane protein OmpA-like peptidoglycan-associated protein